MEYKKNAFLTFFIKKEVIGKGFNVSSGLRSVFLVIFPPLKIKRR